MNNIFENAYFGKPYRTSEDGIALYLGEDIGDFKYQLAYPVISDITNKKSYIILQCDENGSSKCDIDIVSKWQEPINVNKLNKLANDYVGSYGCEHYDDGVEAYKAGYLKAINDNKYAKDQKQIVIDEVCEIFADIINEVLPINTSDIPYIKKFRKTIEDKK